MKKITGLALCALFFMVPSLVYAHQATTTIGITQYGFVPSRVEIEKGGVVLFINTDEGEHWVASDDHPTHIRYPGSDIRLCGTDKESEVFDTCRGLAKGEEHSFTFNKSGTWGFHDHIHPQFTGSIVVEGPADELNTKQEKSALSFLKKMEAFLLRQWYELFPGKGEAHLNKLNLVETIKKDETLEYWMRVFDYKEIFSELERDAMDPTQRPGTPGAQRIVGQCHTEAHFAGRMTYRLYGISALDESGLDTRCQFGFYHGIIEASLGGVGDDEAVKSFAQKCERYARDPIRRTFCNHAIGHALIVKYNADLPMVIQKCSDLTLSEPGRRMCYHGAFMENAFSSWGGGVIGYESRWIDSTRPDFPCDSDKLPESPYVREMCYTAQSLLWSHKPSGFDVQASIEGCTRAPASAKEMCYAGFGFNMAFPMGKNTLSEDQIVLNCAEIPNSKGKTDCLLGALFMRSTHWGTFTGFKNKTLCSALKKEDLNACDAYVREAFSWLEGD